MSITIVTHPNNSAYEEAATTRVVGYARTSGIAVNERVRPVSFKEPIKNRYKDPLKDFRVVRRMKGFLTENQGQEWRVVFVDNNERYDYDLPAAQLRDAGIISNNQPFQMDEMESTIPGLSGTLYRFKALAMPEDAFLETLELDDERKAKRNEIFSWFGKPKS